MRPLRRRFPRSKTMAGMAASGMSEDCMKMMAQQQQPVQKPCKGMTLACIAAMGLRRSRGRAQ